MCTHARKTRLQDYLIINIYGSEQLSQFFLNRDSYQGKVTGKATATVSSYPGIPSQAQTCLDFQE